MSDAANEDRRQRGRGERDGRVPKGGDGVDLIIKAEHLTLRFGGVVSLRDVSLEMRRGEILAVIGPNGAGKTSLFNSITGVYQPQEGIITFSPRGKAPLSVIGKKAHRIAQAGVSRTFQASRLFTALSVFENVKIGAEDHRGIGLVGALVKGPARVAASIVPTRW